MTTAVILPDATSGLSAFVFDVVTSEVHEHTNEVTEFPVEFGADISDHVRVKPTQVTITGVITNAPIVETGGGFVGQTVLDVPVYTPPLLSFTGAATAIASLLFGPAPPTIIDVLQFPVDIDPILDAHNLLLAIKEGRVLCDVTTSTQEYTSMVLTSLSMHRDQESGKAEFTVVFKEIITVETATVAAPVPLIPAGAPKTSVGSQGTTAPTQAQKDSVLNSIIGKIAG